ncbi:FKBP-type peptidyl-prolyl cis-trans isomerase [Rhodocytophaga aerolata]|uniref:Peptidyl-prolyl cis-trans isomerase n=1 Tax=Rhodocytophaga aerolata TaxID=455078 RepID=A0ABT8R7V1_9BACT|nr:FKBP-type peptidyl-prolyl cis-trans isomerase [Rhodocytophaga aerolata]MDO1448039.1 FKBP-type peptidyl-prolyl cis-trans isomerase [Rhodocytophaga aerolata]
MTVNENKVVSLTYELRTNDENGQQTLVEKVEQDNPMVFLYGVGGLLERFEDNIKGLAVGDPFEFSIDPEEGYGEFDEEAVVSLPKDVFKVNGKVDETMLQVGNFIPMTDNEGNRLQGRVLEVESENVVMDFNHPLAGKNMHFKGTVVGVRDATSEELAHGHVHGEGGHHH